MAADEADILLLKATILFLSTFETDLKCEKDDIRMLRDSVFLLQCLHNISPDRFPLDSFNGMQDPNDPSTAIAKIATLGTLIEAYFTGTLRKRLTGLPLNAKAIACEDDHTTALVSLMELIVGAAVMCENRAIYIKKVFQLSSDNQRILKTLVERCQHRCEDIMSAAEETDVDNNKLREDQLRAQELVRHLREAREKAEQDVQTLLDENGQLKESNTSLEAKLKSLQDEQAQAATTDRQRAVAAETRANHLETELQDCRRELDLSVVSQETLNDKLRRADKQLDQLREAQVNLQLSAQRQAEELEAAREKSARLIKAEALCVKYQQRLEEIPVLKQENKEQVQLLEQYSARIAELEGNSQEMIALNSLLENYKNGNVELERSRFEALSAVQMLKTEVARLETELESQRRAHKDVQTELLALRNEVEVRASVDALDIEARRTEAADPDSKASLRGRIQALERELSARMNTSGTQSFVDQELTLCRAEVERLREEKKGREDLLLETKKQLSNAQVELKHTMQTLQDLQTTHKSLDIAAKEAREVNQKFVQAEGTITRLEELLKEKEGLVFRLETDRSKLEQFSRNTLSAFKNKFMSTLHKVQAEKEALEAALERLANRAEFDRETSRREERLLLSAMYNIGVKIMDKNLQATSR